MIVWMCYRGCVILGKMRSKGQGQGQIISGPQRWMHTHQWHIPCRALSGLLV